MSWLLLQVWEWHGPSRKAMEGLQSLDRTPVMERQVSFLTNYQLDNAVVCLRRKEQDFAQRFPGQAVNFTVLGVQDLTPLLEGPRHESWLVTKQSDESLAWIRGVADNARWELLGADLEEQEE